jgi:alpha-beta hydrolase superfamily lysophospholipase
VVVSQKPVPPRSGDALAAIEERGITLYRTWRDGAIDMRYTGRGISVRGFLEQEKDPGQAAVFAGVLPALGGLVHASNAKLLFCMIGVAIGALACAVLAVVEIAAWSLVAPSRSRSHHAEDDPDSRELDGLVQPIEVRAADGARLAGRFMAAQGPAPPGRTVLLLHGFAETSRALERRRMAALSRHGWNVAALDSRAYGQSDGPYATFGGHESSDVRIWLDRLAECVSRSGPDSGFRPALWGRSMGAQIAMRTAAEDTRVAALVLESPLIDLAAATAAALRRRRFPMSGLLARLIIGRANKLAGMPLDRPRPIDLAPRLTCPVLILHGSDDVLVSADDARRLATAFANSATCRDVPCAGHSDVVETGGEPLLDEVAAFLDKGVGQNERVEFTKPGEMRPDPASLETQA